jgi:hypothetical protein
MPRTIIITPVAPPIQLSAEQWARRPRIDPTITPSDFEGDELNDDPELIEMITGRHPCLFLENDHA